MAKKQKAFRLDEKTLNELQTLCNEWEVNQTEAVERVIHSAFESYKNSYTTSYTDSAQSYTENNTLDTAFKILEKQLEEKDKHIGVLNQALLNAQEQGKAAQALQAAEKIEKQESDKQLPETTDKNKSWFQRVLDRLTGEQKEQ